MNLPGTREPAMSMMSLTNTAIRTWSLPRWSDARSTVGEWKRRIQSRYELERLSERDLSDIGMTTLDAFDEIQKPFWRA